MFNLEESFTFKPTDPLKGQSPQTHAVVILKGPILQNDSVHQSFLSNMSLLAVSESPEKWEKSLLNAVDTVLEISMFMTS